MAAAAGATRAVMFPMASPAPSRSRPVRVMHARAHGAPRVCPFTAIASVSSFFVSGSMIWLHSHSLTPHHRGNKTSRTVGGTLTPPQSLSHSLSRSLTHSLTHSLTGSLTHHYRGTETSESIAGHHSALGQSLVREGSGGILVVVARPISVVSSVEGTHSLTLSPSHVRSSIGYYSSMRLGGS